MHYMHTSRYGHNNIQCKNIRTNIGHLPLKMSVNISTNIGHVPHKKHQSREACALKGSVPPRLEENEKTRKKKEKKEKKEGKKRELPDSCTLQVLLLIFYYLYLLDIENSILVFKVLNYVTGRCIW